MPTLPATLSCGSQTCLHLADACRHSAFARHSYLNAADAYDNAGLQVVSHAFRFTAAQEKEHAAVLLGLLQTLTSSIPAPVVECFPLETPCNLLSAASAEEENARRCQAHARIATAEGLPRIAAAFNRIAETEQLHSRRFHQYAVALQDGSLLHSPESTTWLCLPCGQHCFGCEPPIRCDACGSPAGAFIRSDFRPFAVRW